MNEMWNLCSAVVSSAEHNPRLWVLKPFFNCPPEKAHEGNCLGKTQRWNTELKRLGRYSLVQLWLLKPSAERWIIFLHKNGTGYFLSLDLWMRKEQDEIMFFNVHELATNVWGWKVWGYFRISMCTSVRPLNNVFLSVFVISVLHVPDDGWTAHLAFLYSVSHLECSSPQVKWHLI